MVEWGMAFENIGDWFYRWRTYNVADPGDNPLNSLTSDVEKSLKVLTDSQRKQRLEYRIVQYLKDGWMAERVGDFQAVVTYEDKINHVVHAILSLITFGFWLLIWLFLSLTKKTTRRTIRVNEYGQFIEN